MFFVVDTHPLIWYLSNELNKLPQNIDAMFRNCEIGNCTIFVPTIVLAECYYLSESKKIDLDFENILSKIEKSSNFLITPFNIDILRIFKDVNIKEIHDKIIVATTKLLDATLITKDKEIINSNIVKTIW